MPRVPAAIIVAISTIAISNCTNSPTRSPRIDEVRLSFTGGNVVPLGDTTQIAVRAELTDGREIDVTIYADLTSGDPNVVTVAPNGVATAVGLGATTVKATLDDMTAEADLLVIAP